MIKRILLFCCALVTVLGVFAIALFVLLNYQSSKNASSRTDPTKVLLEMMMWNVAAKQAHNTGIELLGELPSDSYDLEEDPQPDDLKTFLVYDSSRKFPSFRMNKRIQLPLARKYAFEVVSEFRKRLANHKSIIKLFDRARPPYDLQRQGFPLKFTYLTVNFYPKDKQFRYKDPYISRVLIEKGNFRYFVSEPDKNDLKEVYQETYVEAEAFYNSIVKQPTDLDKESNSQQKT